MDIMKEIISIFFITMGAGFLFGLFAFVAISTYIKLSNILSKKVTINLKENESVVEQLTLSKEQAKGFKIAMKKLAGTEVSDES